MTRGRLRLVAVVVCSCERTARGGRAGYAFSGPRSRAATAALPPSPHQHHIFVSPPGRPRMGPAHCPTPPRSAAASPVTVLGSASQNFRRTGAPFKQWRPRRRRDLAGEYPDLAARRSATAATSQPQPLTHRHHTQGSIIVTRTSFSNSGSKRSMICCGSGHSFCVGDQAELHAAAVGQDAHAHADVARGRHPEHGLAQRRRRRSFSGCAGPGTLVITAVAFLANRPSSASCTGLISRPGHRQHRERQQRLVAALQLVHARAHRVDPLDRVVDADRQHQRRQAEAVAELARPCRAGAGSPAPSRGSPCRSGRRPGRAGTRRWRRPRRPAARR